jgi:hypothetical protein
MQPGGDELISIRREEKTDVYLSTVQNKYRAVASHGRRFVRIHVWRNESRETYAGTVLVCQSGFQYRR